MWTPRTLPEVLCSNSVCFKYLTNADSLFFLLIFTRCFDLCKELKKKNYFNCIVIVYQHHLLSYENISLYTCHVFAIHGVHMSHLNYLFLSHSEPKLLPCYHHHAITIPSWSSRHNVFEIYSYDSKIPSPL